MSDLDNRKPSHHVYTIREGGQDNKDYWNRVGTAFPHKDGKGFSLLLDAMPFDGRLTLRQAETEDNA